MVDHDQIIHYLEGIDLHLSCSPLTYPKVYVHSLIRKGSTSATSLNPSPNPIPKGPNYLAIVALFKQTLDPNQPRLAHTPPTPAFTPTPTPTPNLSDASIGSGMVDDLDGASSNLTPAAAAAAAGTLNPNLNPNPNPRGEAFTIGETPLMVAALCRRADVLHLLLKAPDIDIGILRVFACLLVCFSAPAVGGNFFFFL